MPWDTILKGIALLAEEAPPFVAGFLGGLAAWLIIAGIRKVFRAIRARHRKEIEDVVREVNHERA